MRGTIDSFWKASNYMYHHGARRLGRILELFSMTISSHGVSAQIDIGKDSIFLHHALGCVVLETTRIGCGCIIMQNVTIGNTFSDKTKNLGGCCSIGDNVVIGAGACILGHVHVGNNVTIGANAVVLKDVEDNTVVAGVPAKIKRVKEVIK